MAAVSVKRSIAYNTSRALADLLGPPVGTTKHHVKNSKELAQELSSVTLEQEEISNSHDVVTIHQDPYAGNINLHQERMS